MNGGVAKKLRKRTVQALWFYRTGKAKKKTIEHMKGILTHLCNAVCGRKIEHDDWASMLVYSPNELSFILHTLTTDYRPSLRDYTPAKGLYLLCRFACIWGDSGWIEDLIAGAVDRIEEAVYVRNILDFLFRLISSGRLLRRIFRS